MSDTGAVGRRSAEPAAHPYIIWCRAPQARCRSVGAAATEDATLVRSVRGITEDPTGLASERGPLQLPYPDSIGEVIVACGIEDQVVGRIPHAPDPGDITKVEPVRMESPRRTVPRTPTPA